ncbi:CRAL-TRIO domain-containing protein [Roridomyces roridus]|uniref:CRAL-TRIO domain-containing protein n=1 Tax=Roridomyces roridus TaxID=1738132 RepID=A0AAD7C5U2_9AGAR|nr:CRAL-TRIO domain-containing protein [Roridomyces roridus]
MAKDDLPTDASASTSHNLAGQLGHLSPEQETSFAEFKVACEKDGLWTPGKTRPSLNEAALLRYLRARKFVVNDALAQLKDTEQWRETNKLDELYDTFDVDVYEEARKVYHQWTGRRDFSGRPVYVYEISHIKNHMASFEKSSTILKNASPTSSSDPIPPKMRMLCALYENMSEFVLPLCNAVPDRPNPEGHMQAASTLATAHYPETLDRLFILGAPSFFPTVWGWIKRWFDPVTTSKIFILSAADMKPTLTQFMRVEDLPKKYGGELDWEYGMPPNVDSGIVAAVKGLGSSAWVKGSVRWVQEPQGGGKIVKKGLENGKQRDEVVATMDAAN